MWSTDVVGKVEKEIEDENILLNFLILVNCIVTPTSVEIKHLGIVITGMLKVNFYGVRPSAFDLT